MKPSGPLMKIPSNGPWFASGVKISGPKNPPQKPSAPATTAQERAVVSMPLQHLRVCAKPKKAAAAADNKEAESANMPSGDQLSEHHQGREQIDGQEDQRRDNAFYENRHPGGLAPAVTFVQHSSFIFLCLEIA